MLTCKIKNFFGYFCNMNLQTPIQYEPLADRISFGSRVVCLGSCFASNVGGIMKDLGFDIMVNPFGVLYNPASIASSLTRLDSAMPFTQQDVICSQGLWCSFFHHSSMGRSSSEEFLHDANEALQADSLRWAAADWVIVSLGTAFVFRHIERDIVVSNCHKVVPQEFVRERLTVEQCVSLLTPLIEAHPEKKWIFTVSPIRHLKDGLHGNRISKATLLLAVEELQGAFPNVHYFPAYEIMDDELRDYRFYDEDMTHPTRQAVNYIWEHFINFATDPLEVERIRQEERRLRRSQHIPIRK